MIPETLTQLTVPITDVRPYGRNPRRGNVAAIAESLRVNGQYRPIVVNRRTGEILAGNHTYQAALTLGWDRIAATFVDVDEQTAARIVVVDNRASDVAGWDDEELAALLAGLDDLAGSGFSEQDLAALLADVNGEPVGRTDVDDAPQLPEQPVSAPGDVWRLGPNLLLCGDATDAGAVAVALDGQQPNCVWTDPPYGVSYVGKTADALTIENDGRDGLGGLLAGAFATLVAVAAPGAPVYVAHADTARVTFEQAMRGAGIAVRQTLVWVKNTLVMGHADYQYKHEPILYGFAPGKKGRLGRGGQNWLGDNTQTTVLDVPKPARNREHPTMKPVALIRPMLANSCPVGGLVLDLFGGSGSTLLAAHHERMRAALVELDPRYADAICRRWQEHTGELPVLARTGKPHDFVAE